MTTTESPEAGERTQLTLKSLIGQPVTVQNIAHVEMEDGKFQFCMNGVLEAAVDDDPNYFLRVKECYNGTSGIAFNEQHLAAEEGIYKQPSGRIEITLK